MNRRQLLALAATTLLLPTERQRVYSFMRPTGLILLDKWARVETHAPIEFGHWTPEFDVCLNPDKAEVFVKPPYQDARLEIERLDAGGLIGDLVILGEALVPGIRVDLRGRELVTDIEIAKAMRRAKAELDARGIWS